CCRSALTRSPPWKTGPGPLRCEERRSGCWRGSGKRCATRWEGCKLPADYEARLFSYFDKLAADRAAAATRRAADSDDAADAGETAGTPAAPPSPVGPAAAAPS